MFGCPRRMVRAFTAFRRQLLLVTEIMTTQSESEAERYHLSISWDDVQRDAGLLAQSLVGKGPWHGIVAVARGGLVPAALVARALNVRMLETVSAVAYHGEVLGSPRIAEIPDRRRRRRGLADYRRSGRYRDDNADCPDNFAQAHVAVLYAKPLGRPLADSFVQEFPQESWVDFPWEMDSVD